MLLNITRSILILTLTLITALLGCEKDESGRGTLELLQVFVGNVEINTSGSMSTGLPVDRNISLTFSSAIDQASAESSIILRSESGIIDFDLNFSSANVTILPDGALENNAVYTIGLTDQLKGTNGSSFSPIEISFKTVLGALEILSIRVSGEEVGEGNILHDFPLDFSMALNFSAPVDLESLKSATDLSGPNVPALQFVSSNNDQTVEISGSSDLRYLTKYEFEISDDLTGAEGEPFSGMQKVIYSALDSTLKFPEVSDEELLTKVQEQTFKYFWDFGHPNSGLTRERNTSEDVVTIGGSGFGVMAILVGIERGFISREEGVTRLKKIVDFLSTADRFHGVWPHWMNGNTGEVIPFSSDDDGGDIVETAFMIQGLLTARQYLDKNDETEKGIIDKINVLWEEVEWDWYTQGENSITWHWSPNVDFSKNHKVRGWNEALIVYVLAASSPTHTISTDVYHEGWARSGGMVNGNSFFNIELPLGPDYGGPLFFEHYSFLGLDPRNLSDQYADYGQQTEAHTLINRAYCMNNPKQYLGYSEYSWGLTASDNHEGYSAHSPTNDLGVITPTAALSSFPYTPEESMDALRHFYFILGDRLWGEYGFYDAFNFTENWVASSYLAIDQGPIIIMIENHRTALLWDLFMSCPEVQDGLDKLDFNY